MHKEILSKKQAELLPSLKSVIKDFGLVDGTAIALHIGHRQSIDFDFFKCKEFDNSYIQKKIKKANLKIEKVFVDKKDEYTILINGVKITFLYYPFKINFSEEFNDYCKIADLSTLAALKAYALGRRVKWKDYVDLYFIMKNHCNIKEIVKKSQEIFGNNFNEKQFRSQLSYFKDIDHSEKIIYANHSEIDDKIIQKELINFSLII